MKTKLLLPALVAALLFVSSKPVLAADLTVAPLSGMPYGAHEIWAHNQMGQSFVATATIAKLGFLVIYNPASAAIGSPNSPITTMTVNLYQGETLGGQLLASQNLVVDNTQNGYLDIDLSTFGVSLQIGQQYTLGLSTLDRGWIIPSACVYPANAQPTGSYDLGHPFFQGLITTNETGICDNSFHLLDLDPVVVPTPIVTPTPTPTPTPSPVVTTTKKVEGKGTISSVSDSSLVVNKVVIRYNTSTLIKYNYAAGFAVGQKIQYKGFKNTDGTINATQIEIN